MEKQGVVSVANAILIGTVLISFSILLSGGVIKIKGLTINKGTAPAAQAPAPSSAPAPAAAPDNGPVQVAVADAPMLGEKNAPITMVEFSDYECPFCKRHFTDTYPDLKKNYIDTGKLKLYFRNLPLSFHQNAHKEAEAALCVKDQGGDSAYWKFHDLVFTKTTSNGTGLNLDQIPSIAKDSGVDGDKVKTCMDNGKYKDYVDKDLSYASSIGATGTPTFFVGKSDPSGTITASRIVGAQPYSSFQSQIDPLLK